MNETIFVCFELCFYLVKHLINLVDVFHSPNQIGLIICGVCDCERGRLEHSSSRVVWISAIGILNSVDFDS